MIVNDEISGTKHPQTRFNPASPVNLAPHIQQNYIPTPNASKGGSIVGNVHHNTSQYYHQRFSCNEMAVNTVPAATAAAGANNVYMGQLYTQNSTAMATHPDINYIDAASNYVLPPEGSQHYVGSTSASSNRHYLTPNQSMSPPSSYSSSSSSSSSSLPCFCGCSSSSYSPTATPPNTSASCVSDYSPVSLSAPASVPASHRDIPNIHGQRFHTHENTQAFSTNTPVYIQHHQQQQLQHRQQLQQHRIQQPYYTSIPYNSPAFLTSNVPMNHHYHPQHPSTSATTPTITTASSGTPNTTTTPTTARQPNTHPSTNNTPARNSTFMAFANNPPPSIHQPSVITMADGTILPFPQHPYDSTSSTTTATTTAADIPNKSSPSLATKISNILNHDHTNPRNNNTSSIHSIINNNSPTRPRASTRSNISNLLSDPIPDTTNSVWPIPVSNNDCDDGKHCDENDKSKDCTDGKHCGEESNGNEADSSIISNDAENVIKPDPENPEMTITTNPQSITLKMSPKKNRKQKILKIHLASPTGSKDKVAKKLQNETKTKEKKFSSKFVTLKIDSNKLKNIIDDDSLENVEEAEEEIIEPKATMPTPTTPPKKKENKSIKINDLNTSFQSVEMTSNQLVQIQHNNQQSDEPTDAEKSTFPSFFQLENKGLPAIPKGYIPLVMAPDGKMYPMEFINVDAKNKSVSIMRPLWDGLDFANQLANISQHSNGNRVNNDGKISKKKRKTRKVKKRRSGDDDHYEHHSQKKDDDEDDDANGDNRKRRRGNGPSFNSVDKAAALQMYMLSKESKLNNKTDRVYGNRKHQTEINYYNRLLEKEQLEYLDTYRQKRNKYQAMLNELESGDNMLSVEKDILEMRDYELLREQISKNYDEDHTYLNCLDRIVELQSMQCLDYSTRLVKLKNYLNMEKARLERHKNRLCRITNNKSHGIWKRYVKSGNNRNRKSNGDSNSSSTFTSAFNFNFQLISQNDFMVLTNPNSRSYGTYVLNNSVDKGNENQHEIVELIDYYVPDKSTLKDLYREMKKYDNNHTIIDKNLKNTSVNSVQKNDMISKYGLKESNGNVSNRLLRELQIDGMNVDIEKNDRVERRGSGQRKVRNAFGGRGSSNSSKSNENGEYIEDGVTDPIEDSGNNRRFGNSYRNESSKSNGRSYGNSDEDVNNGNNVNNDINDDGDNNNDYDNMNENVEVSGSSGTGSRNELNITSCLDPSLCDIDRVKMLNLDCNEIGINFTKVYGMPKGLHRDEIESDLLFLRNALK